MGETKAISNKSLCPLGSNLSAFSYLNMAPLWSCFWKGLLRPSSSSAMLIRMTVSLTNTFELRYEVLFGSEGVLPYCEAVPFSFETSGFFFQLATRLLIRQ
uniref:Uncharacterized protein n=1 Tax=Opuntia streptacantha TaxID=393608 RepID=A0A7C9EI15_OPUST